MLQIMRSVNLNVDLDAFRDRNKWEEELEVEVICAAEVKT